jgi:KUP system potassium uptake protein
MDSQHSIKRKLSAAGAIITLGIVFGDLGTSPLYVMKAIIAGLGITLNAENIIGAISCIIWTLTLQTTVKYVIITMRADNKGEGGIFSLYALIRKRRKSVYVLAIIGGAALLADGIITPSITVVSAIEGLRMVRPDVNVVPIALVIITLLFFVQQFGTDALGKSFGPIMVVWFVALGVLGLSHIPEFPVVLKAFNPIYAFRLLFFHPGGFLLLGAVFLCTTGAEALYSDLGHCGFNNIRISWIFVKINLILNYLGQGAWIITHKDIITSETNPFFTIMPQWALFPGIILATAAAIIASQALISGSYTIISEGIHLNFWPKVKIKYPTRIKGQMYIPSVNWILYIACMGAIMLFKESSKMEAAYGLSITITMLMTTMLMTFYLSAKKISRVYIAVFLASYVIIEGSFLISNLHKFVNGGWFTIMMASFIFTIMYSWYKARSIKKAFLKFDKISDYSDVLKDLHNDHSIPKFSTNLVYLTRADYPTDIEAKIMYSIINKQPKRADLYWFFHVDIVDEPHTLEYKLEHIIPFVLVRVDFKIGFKVEPRINLYFKQILEDLMQKHEIDIISHYPSLRKYGILGDFKYIITDRVQNYDFDFSPIDQFIMQIHNLVKRIAITNVKAYGLDTSNVTIEKVPLMVDPPTKVRPTRIN